MVDFIVMFSRAARFFLVKDPTWRNLRQRSVTYLLLDITFNMVILIVLELLTYILIVLLMLPVVSNNIINY